MNSITNNEIKELYIVGFDGRNKAPLDIREVFVDELPYESNDTFKVVRIGANDSKLPMMTVTLGSGGYVNINSGLWYCNHKAIIDKIEEIKNR